MGVVYRIEHDTRYLYGAAAPISRHTACLRPRELPRQRVHWHALRVSPEPAERVSRIDYFGNHLDQFSILGNHHELLVRAESIVEVHEADLDANGCDLAWEQERDSLVYRKGAPGRPEAEYLFPSPYIDVEEESLDYAKASFPPGRALLDAAIDLMHRMHEDFTFDAEATAVTTPVTAVLADRRGVCQDLAHVMISCLRAVGIPARYVSGYLLTDPPPGQPRLVGADASHAWVQVHCGDGGAAGRSDAAGGSRWIDLDPTNDVRPGLRHVVVGYGRDYGDVCPLRGVFVGGGEHALEIGVSVHPLEDAELAGALASAEREPRLGFGPG